MNNEKMWVYMMKLGSNMWAKKGSKRSYETSEEFKYHEEVFCEMDIWRKVTDFLPGCGINTLLIDVGESIKLDSHPELAIPGSLEKDVVRAELRRLRAMGITPIPKLNFSASHNAWLQEYAFMVGTQVYDQVCKDVLLEVMEVFDYPEFFHLGLDEEFIEAQKHHPVRTVRAPYKYAEDMQVLFDICLSKGVRPWMWMGSDPREIFGGDKEFMNIIPREVLLSSHCYGELYKTEPPAAVKFYKKLEDMGYEQVPCCSTFEIYVNVDQTFRFCKEEMKDDLLKGCIIAPWLFTKTKNYYGLLDAAWLFGCAKQKYYPNAEPKVTHTI